jgi:uncharacterized protein (DUF2249 family)
MDYPPSSADELREQLRAEAMLAKLDVLEDLALVHDHEPMPALRQTLSMQYRQAVGVVPGRRDEFRTALIRVLEGGGQTIADAIKILNRDDQ